MNAFQKVIFNIEGQQIGQKIIEGISALSMPKLINLKSFKIGINNNIKFYLERLKLSKELPKI